MTARQLEIIQHALGVDKFGRIPKGFDDYTRNHFCAGERDRPDCEALVMWGFAETFERAYLPYYNIRITELGQAAMRQESPAPPKLTRSQERYQRFLDADSGMKFGEWLKYEREATA